MSVLKILSDIFVYKEPVNKELGFELLEDSGEGSGGSNAGNPPGNAGGNASGSAPGSARPRKSKRPVSAEKWKEKKAEDSPEKDPDDISSDIDKNLQTIRQKFSVPQNRDIVIREFNIGRKLRAFFIFVENIIDKKQLNLNILPDLMAKDVLDCCMDECPVDYLMKNVITSDQIEKTDKYSKAVLSALSGGGVLFIDGCAECVMIQMMGAEKRSVTTPKIEPIIKGSQEAFIESLDTNISLIRKIIRNENMTVEYIPVGSTNHSQCAIVYLKGVANGSVVAEVRKRIKSIDASFIDGTGFVEQFIQDNSYLLFPQLIDTERPDRAAFLINEGLVIIISDGTPLASAVPCTFFRLMHTAEDANLRWSLATFLRLIRYLGLFCAIFLPGMYLSVTLFHVEMIPTELLISIAKSKEMVPFPTILELLLLEVSFELIREGAVRVPGLVGQTLGIVGALILGQAAVTANLISPVMVIIVSITAIGSFCIPSYELSIAIRIIRFAFMFAGAFFGFYGITVLASVAMLLGCGMKSFGVPFFAPVAPKTKSDKNVIIKKPVIKQNERQDSLNSPDRVKHGNNVGNWTDPKPNGGAV